jgi:uncharacterized membrane protein YqaE (UPF0057 family)
MVHPGIKRKQEAEEDRQRSLKVVNEGPISLLITYLIDLVADIGKLLINMTKGFRMSGSKFVYDMVYKDGSKVIRSADKYGTMISLKPFRILLSILYPPLGVFISRGIYGLHYAIIALVLTYFNVLVGICFALVITNIPHYGDKFAQFDFYRLITIRQLVSNCKNTIINDTYEVLPLIILLGTVALITTLLYLFMKFL